MSTPNPAVHQSTIDDFLAGRRIAVIGASDDPKNFAHTVYNELKSHGHEPVAVHPTAEHVDGDAAYPDVASVPGELDRAIVMVSAEHAAAVVAQCADRGIEKVWLFRGIGGDGAMSPEVLAVCEERHLEVVAGACPLMFLEPVGWFHRLHRSARRHNGGLDAVAEPMS